ncbi:UDP-N-acetylmuramoyl-L-alanine--D-glutamate ligase [Patescibacteria group bacterium]|nr:UDP-N-acetylmuramoyl-L-alanine--D-glutamate ligase [Patescibacteria group bacterium]
MKPSDFRGKKITIMGLGTLGGGIGVVQYLVKLGAKLTVTDLRIQKQLAPALKKIKSKGIIYVLGKHREQDFKNADLIVKNPAVPKASKYLEIARQNNVPIESDATLFFQLCRIPIIGVTGTKGKTTTVALLEKIIKRSGRHVVLVGHNQISVLDRLNQIKKDTIVLFELSSWRLEILREHKLSPHGAIVTNIAKDHLNTYSGMSEYVKAKSNIFAFQNKNDFVVLNKQNPYTQQFGKSVISRRFWFSKVPFTEQNGVFVKNSKIVFRNMGKDNIVLSTDTLKIRGEHNLENVLAAVLTAKILQVPNIYIKSAIAEFSGLTDRLEFVKKYNGKSFFNDTAATMPDATIAALRSFPKKVVLIAGGVDKELSYFQLANAIKKHARVLVLLPGSATEKLKLYLDKNKTSYTESKTLQQAVETAYNLANETDSILFSPGAASFNLFENEFDRGEKFRKIVKKLT